MMTTGRIAKALRKNTTCPTGIASPKPRMSADITANSSAEASLSRIPLATCMERDAGRRRGAGAIRGRESTMSARAREAGCAHASWLVRAWRRFVRMRLTSGTIVLFLCRFLPFHRRQRFDVGGNGGAIICRKLRGVAHHLGHLPTDGISFERLPRLEQIRNVVLRPVAEPLRREIGNRALPLRIRPAGEALRGNDAAHEIARAVAFRTVPRPLDQISAAVE